MKIIEDEAYDKLILESIQLKEKIAELNKTIFGLEEIIDLIKSKYKFVEVEGWKGTAGTQVTQEGKTPDIVWVLTTWKKDKKTWERKEEVHRIPGANVNKLWQVMRKVCPNIGDSIKNVDLMAALITHYGWPTSLGEFYGHKNRSKYYFPFYQWPCKVLEAKGYIDYGEKKSKRLK